MEDATWPAPSRLRTWTDAGGSTWHRVGDSPLQRAAARRLVQDGSVRVVRFYGLQPAEVSDGDREALWDRIEPTLRGKRIAGSHEDFMLFKFRDDRGNQLLAVEENC